MSRRDRDRRRTVRRQRRTRARVETVIRWATREAQRDIAELHDGGRTSPYAVNNGWCGFVAELALERLGELGIPALRLDDSPDLVLTPTWDPTHVWIYCDGLHYDAEAPRGVACWLRLPHFRRYGLLAPRARRRPPEERWLADMQITLLRRVLHQIEVERGAA